MSKKAYLVKLVDMDDGPTVKVVDQEVWDWINLRSNGRDPKSKKSSFEDTLCTDAIKEKIRKFQESEHDEFESRFNPTNPSPFKFRGVFLSVGSWENDRAIFAPPLDNNSDFNCVGNTTKHTLELIKKLESMGYELDLENEYNGLIY